MIKTDSHPTVDTIYTSLLPEMPTLSKTTVYKTMDLLIEAKLARLVHTDEKEAHYDADVSDHGHFKCTRCNRIYDFTINFDHIKTGGLAGFCVNEKNVVYKGICPRCLTP